MILCIIYLFIYSFNRLLLSTYFGSDTVLDIRDRAVHKQTKFFVSLPSCRLHSRKRKGEIWEKKKKIWLNGSYGYLRKQQSINDQVASLVAQMVESFCNAGDLGSISGAGRSLDKEMATHSSILAWKVPWTEQPGGLQSMALQRVGHNRATNTQMNQND